MNLEIANRLVQLSKKNTISPKKSWLKKLASAARLYLNGSGQNHLLQT